MKTKFLFSILLIAILLAMTVGAVDFTVTQPEKFSQELASVTFQVTATDNLTVTFSPLPLEISGESGYKAVFKVFEEDGTEVESEEIIGAGTTKTLTIKPSTSIEHTKFKLGKIYSTILNVQEKTDLNITKPITLEFIRGFCTGGNTGTQAGKIEITDIEDKTIDNEDEWTWRPLDNIEFEVEVTNNFDEDKRVKVEYEIYDDAGKKLDLNDENQEQSVSVDSDGGDETVTFTLRVPADADEKTYRLYIKAYVKSNEKDGCDDESSFLDNAYYQEVRIEKEDDRAVIVDMDKIEFSQDSFKCGDKVSLSARVYNVGNEDEDKVKVRLYNKELGIDASEETSNLDEGDNAQFTFEFTVPEKSAEKNYLLELITFYDYDEDADEYDSNSKDDLDKDFLIPLKVSCLVEEVKAKSAVITAELESEEAIAGEQLVIKGAIENTGEEKTTYSLSVIGYEDWAEFDNIKPETITLEVGKSADFKIYFNVNEDVEGEQFFTIKAEVDDKTIREQEVSVEFEEKEERVGITGAVIAENLRKNWFIWVIVVINVILIIAIIAVARRIASAK